MNCPFVPNDVGASDARAARDAAEALVVAICLKKEKE